MNQEDMVDKAFSYFEEGNIKEAVKYFDKLANIGNIEGQFCMARFYWSGNEIIEENGKLALYWYEKAAKQGHPLAQLWLGNAYMHGAKSDINYEKAVHWYKKAIKQNIATAQYHLGLCYYYGLGVDRDEQKTIELIKKAADNNLLAAELFVADFYRNTSQIDNIYIASMEEKYKKKMYKDPEIAKQFADAYMRGHGLVCNYNKAFELYSLSILDDNEDVLLARANCFEKGLGTEKNTQKALRIYEAMSKNSLKALSKYLLLCKQTEM